jgi:hypothetical protein
VTEANTSVVILTGVLFTLLHNIFRWLPVNGHDINKRSAEILKSLQVADRYCPVAPAPGLRTTVH